MATGLVCLMLCFELQSLALLSSVLLFTFTFLSILLFCMYFQVSLSLVASRKATTTDLARERLLSGMGSVQKKEKRMNKN